MGVSTAAGHRTTIDRVSTDRQRVVVKAKVRHIVAGSCHGERVGRVGGNFHTVLCPVDKGVSLSRNGRQGNILTVRVVACTGHCTTSGRISRSVDSVGVGFEVGNVVTTFCHHEDVCGIGGHFITILRPVDKVIACIGYGRQ